MLLYLLINARAAVGFITHIFRLVFLIFLLPVKWEKTRGVERRSEE